MDHTHRPGGSDPPLTGGRGVDVAIEALGTQATFEPVRACFGRAAPSPPSASIPAICTFRSTPSPQGSATTGSLPRSVPAARSACAGSWTWSAPAGWTSSPWSRTASRWTGSRKPMICSPPARRRAQGGDHAMNAESPVLWFEDVGAADVPSVGGKNASLGEMVRALSGAGVRVPPGFATTAAAYRDLVTAAGNEAPMGPASKPIGVARRRCRTPARRSAGCSSTPKFHRHWRQRFAMHIAARQPPRREEPAVAVRSSATAEDLPDASFAGQQETFLNVVGERDCWMPAGDATRRCSPTGRSATGTCRASII